MSHGRSTVVMAAALVLLVGVASDASAQMFVAAGRDTLRGLPGVEIVVEPIQPEMEQGELTTAGIRDGAARQLRAAGIAVYATQEENPSPAKPYVYVHVNGLKLPDHDSYVAGVQVQLRQTLRSEVTGSNIVNATTWETYNVLSVPAVAVDRLREEIADYLDQFIRDWHAVH